MNEQLLKVSLIGDFQRPLQHLIALASIQPIARTMTKLPAWTPQLSNGRELQTRTLLGPAFSVTTLPDQDAFFGGQIPVPPAQPDAVTTLFHSPETRQNEARSCLLLCTQSKWLMLMLSGTIRLDEELHCKAIVKALSAQHLISIDIRWCWILWHI